jgi:hypothetical protein
MEKQLGYKEGRKGGKNRKYERQEKEKNAVKVKIYTERQMKV